jgi:hypothetical protein
MTRNILLTAILVFACNTSFGQTNDDNGVNAGFFDSNTETGFNFSTFKLPPLAVLFENAKMNPTILQLAKQQEIAEADVIKQRKHIFSYVQGHASYSYGKADMWGNNSSEVSPMIYQFQGSEQSYWNLGVNVSVPLEDLLDLGHSVKRKKLAVEDAQLKKDIAFDELKLQIVTLYIRITNNLVALKNAGTSAAIAQGAETLNELEFHHGNMEIQAYAGTGMESQAAVSQYQTLLTQITTDIVTLEILTHTPIITNTTTDITLDEAVEKTEKEIAKENKAVQKRIKAEVEADIKAEKQREKEAEKAAKEAERAAKKEQK